MKSKNNHTYNFQSRNVHFKNILEKSYYIELGVIDMKVMNRFLSGEKIGLNEIVDLEIMADGVGAITKDLENDLYYQLNYLINLRLKNSTFKFILTSGVIKYYDENKCEKYAPLVLIPFDFDYQNFEIIKNAPAYINSLILKQIANDIYKKEEDKRKKENHISLKVEDLIDEDKRKLDEILKKLEEEKKKFIDEFYNRKLSTSFDIDRLGLDLSKIIGTSVDPSNYFTIAYVEYPDIILTNYNMTTNRSIYEMSEYQLNKRYFTEINGILPTNIDQKYVCLKVNDGEKFSVDGRLGSGKTYTIINIIADQISKGKKILYANQDLDNILDLEKNINYLGLSEYVYNLTKNIRDIDHLELDFEDQKKEEVSDECIEEMYSILSDYQKRVHGFFLQSIFEQLAVIKQENPNIECIKLETVLESNEVEKIYNDLLSIEDSLAVIDLYANNIWHRLHTSHNNITEEDIINRIVDLQTSNNELYNALKQYSQKYNLNVPKSVNDFFKLASHIYHFASIKPLPSWKIEDNRREVTKHIREIQSIADENYLLRKYYDEKISEEYHQGRMLDILKEIAGEHIVIDDSLDTKDKIFINRLLNFDDNLTAFTKRIDANIQEISKSITTLKEIFLIKEVTIESCAFFNSLNQFFDNHKINPLIVKVYLDQSSLFSKNGLKIYTAYQDYLYGKEFLPKYVNKFELLTINFFDSIFNKNNVDSVLARYVNKKISKNEHKEVKEIVLELKKFYESMTIIQSSLKELFGEYEYDMPFIEQFCGFYHFDVNLTTKQSNTFKILLNKYKDKNYQASFIDFVSKLLSSFKEEGYNTASICTILRNYNIHITNENIVEKQEQLKKWNSYLRKVDLLKAEIRQIFKDLTFLEYEDVKKLIVNDNKYIKLHKKLENNAQLYVKSIGKYYYGIDTAINDIAQTIEHYGEFLKCINKNCDVDSLFIDETFSKFLDDTRKIDNIYTNWIGCFRAFSICFRAGQPELQYNNFDYNIKLFRQFVEKKAQVAPILNINRLTDSFLEYGLRDLYDGIRSCKYGIGIAKQFMYTVMMGYYNEIKETKPQLLDLSILKENLSNYVKYEYQYCNKNRDLLIENVKDIKKGDTNYRVVNFNNYNNIVKNNIKNIPVFLTDLDILNSDLDLSLFDIVIIDDAHLSSANKYRRIVDAKQAIVFGDVLFQTSVSNALMKRLGDKCTIHFKRRYVQMNSRTNNLWDNNNQYIYSYENRCTIVGLDKLDDFVEEIFRRYKKHTSHIINILVGNEETRRIVYTQVVKRLVKEYNALEITNILSQNIRILNALTEGSRYVNDVFIYFDDIKELEISIQELIFKNFVTAHNSIVIYYVKSRIDSVNKDTLLKINKLIGKNASYEKEASGITKIFIDTLKEKKLKIDFGFGMFDFIIKQKNPLAVMIVGKASDQMRGIYDDYLYYHNEYEKRGWKVKVIYVLDLFKDFNKCVEEIIDLTNSGN